MLPSALDFTDPANATKSVTLSHDAVLRLLRGLFAPPEAELDAAATTGQDWTCLDPHDPGESASVGQPQRELLPYTQPWRTLSAALGIDGETACDL